MTSSFLTESGFPDVTVPFSQWVLSERLMRDPESQLRQLRLRRSLATVAALLMLAGVVLLADPGAAPPQLGLGP